MDKNDNYNELTDDEKHIVLEGGTEAASTGEYVNKKDDGVYECRQCAAPLFLSESKFDSSTGWPSFDDAFPNAIKFIEDGNRTEIRCANCDGHLGHVFYGEMFTSKNARYCTNSLSIKFTSI